MNFEAERIHGIGRKIQVASEYQKVVYWSWLFGMTRKRVSARWLFAPKQSVTEARM